MRTMRSVSLLVVLLAAFASVTLAAKETIGTKATCHNYVCKTEYGFVKSTAEWDQQAKSCACVPYHSSGPCKDSRCGDGYITVEVGNECTCSWPCDGLHCTGPYVAMPDYERKDPDNLCNCQLPPKNKCHEEL